MTKVNLGFLDMPTIATRSCVALIAFALCTPALAQDSFSTLEERMTGKEFRDTGLHKLSDEELAALNEWIRARSLTQEEAVELNQRRAGPADSGSGNVGGDRRGFDDQGSKNSDPIESRLVGSFDGWSGDTRFELENGMVWEQTADDTFYIPEIENPRVTIKKGLFGGWRLHVEGYNKRVKVERVE